MSTSAWKVKSFSARYQELGKQALWLALTELDMDASLRFVGYVLERKRQTSVGWSYYKWMWASAKRSKHRYARGRNKENYWQAGAVLVSCLADRVGLVKGAPTGMIVDKLSEEGKL